MNNQNKCGAGDVVGTLAKNSEPNIRVVFEGQTPCGAKITVTFLLKNGVQPPFLGLFRL
ncbi:MAG: hypothetical protein HQM16_02840 [Deltaproteobacteria bacterium]|nr:hypothetical protein [Deltaproteobacteria bacterium]